MAKNLVANVVTQMDAASSAPILLFEIGLDVGTLRFSATKANIVFPTAGNTYTAKAVQIGGVKQGSDDQISKLTINFDNTAGDMAGYNDAEKFEGKTITVKKVYRDILSNATYYNEIFFGYMQEPKKIDYHWLSVDVILGSILQQKNLLYYYQKECNNIFGDAICNTDGFGDLTSLTATGTADSGSASTLVDNALTQIDDFWNYGRIEVTKAGVLYHRDVIDFVAGTDTVTFDVELPVAVANGDTYSIFKGCSNTWNACQSNEAWGPSADNKANFFGFIHIGDQIK